MIVYSNYMWRCEDKFLHFILQAPIQDSCLCGCCSDGCTPFTMALRRIMATSYGPHPGYALKLIVSHAKDTPEYSQIILRVLTFDGLGLTHTCCHQVKEYDNMGLLFDIKDRDPNEVGEIRDEERALLARFEDLLTEFNSKFDEMGLPILEFLNHYWHPRMMDFLSRRDSYDEDHFTEASRLGVRLELDEYPIPNRVSLRLGSKVWELSGSDAE
ncbi:hypothetical protein BJX61DRAFT_505024 [Aspergillus egyptiacus]|nr:hypothetical protein BJX61DRAFT_505024 [Aspergillus egyptiacus]